MKEIDIKRHDEAVIWMNKLVNAKGLDLDVSNIPLLLSIYAKEYHKAQLRNELIAYDDYCHLTNYSEHEDIHPDDREGLKSFIDSFLKERKDDN